MASINSILGGSISDEDIRRLREMIAQQELGALPPTTGQGLISSPLAPSDATSGAISDADRQQMQALVDANSGSGAISDADSMQMRSIISGDTQTRPVPQQDDGQEEMDRRSLESLTDPLAGDTTTGIDPIEMDAEGEGTDITPDFGAEDGESLGILAPGIGDAFQGREEMDAAANRSSATNNAPEPEASVLPPPVGAPPLPGGPGGVLGGAPPPGAPPMAPEMLPPTNLPPASVLMQQMGTGAPVQMSPQMGTGVPGPGAPGPTAPAFGPGAMADQAQPLQTVGVPPPMRGVPVPTSPSAMQAGQMLQQRTGPLPVPTPNPDAMRQLEQSWQAEQLRRRMMGTR